MKPRLQSKHLVERVALKAGRRRFRVADLASELGETERRVRQAIDAIRRAGGAVRNVGASEFQITRAGPRLSAAAKGGRQ
jgi:hypothetical protein